MDEVLKDVLERYNLTQAKRLIERESAIRQTMAETGESRTIVTEMFDAMESMGQEAVTDLMDGDPTTLAAGIQKLADEIADYEQDMINRDTVAEQLNALLAYPWLGEEEILYSHLRDGAMKPRIWFRRRDETLDVILDGQVIGTYNHDTHGYAGMDAAQEAAHAVYEGVLARVIADREHVIQLQRKDAEALAKHLTSTLGGSWISRRNRLSVDTVAGGGALIRTRPYRYQSR